MEYLFFTESIDMAIKLIKSLLEGWDASAQFIFCSISPVTKAPPTDVKHSLNAFWPQKDITIQVNVFSWNSGLD